MSSKVFYMFLGALLLVIFCVMSAIVNATYTGKNTLDCESLKISRETYYLCVQAREAVKLRELVENE